MYYDLHEPRVDEYFLPFSVVLSTNFVVLFTNHLLFYYSSPKTSEDAHEFIMKLQQLLLDELEDSKKNRGRTLQGETYVNNLYVSMKAFWDLFTGEITHEYTCTSCKTTFQNQELINYLLLKFPKAHHECDEDCTVQSLIEYYLQEEDIKKYHCSYCKKSTLAVSKSSITKFPSFMCILLCCSRSDSNGTITSTVEFPALGFDIKEDHMQYDLYATVHHKPTKETKGVNGHYTTISRSRNLQSQKWFLYDDDRVSSVNFTKTHKNQTLVKKGYMKTATILLYVNPSIKTRIENSKTIDLMEGGKEIDGDGEEGKADGSSGDVTNGVKDGVDIDEDSEKGNAVQTDSGKNPVQDRVDSCMDGEEGKADSSRDENDEADDDEEEVPLASASRRLPRHVMTSTDSSGSSSYSSDSSSDSSDFADE
jgi:hypothetical protein